jgi:hypothetical protein
MAALQKPRSRSSIIQNQFHFILNINHMETKRFTQFGTFSVIVLFPLLIFFIIMICFSGFDDAMEITIFGLIILTFLICLLTFYKLSISIDNSHVSFRLGIGLIHKRYNLSEIESCRPVKNPFWYGIGIRLTPDGWLYNVSGLYAIELTLKSDRSKIRIGTDKPEEISQTINSLLEKANPGFTDDKAHRPGIILFWSVILTALIFPAILILSGSQDTKLIYTDSSFEIKGLYGMTMDYSRINQIDTLNTLPGIKTRTNGYAFGKSLRGNFKLSDQTKVKLFIKKESIPFIMIRTNDAILYLNFRDPQMTINTYKKINNKLTIYK